MARSHSERKCKRNREEALNSYKYFLTYQKAYAILNQGEKHELYNI